jgi:hypothetical protein
MGRDAGSRHPLTAATTIKLVTPRTLVRALDLFGLKWSPVPYEEIPKTSESGLYAWTISSISEIADPLDRPVAYIGIGARRNDGLHGRLSQELRYVTDSAGHAHGRAMSRLHGNPLGGPVHQVDSADLSLIREAISSSDFQTKDSAFQRLEEWLSAPKPIVLSKAEQICIRAAVHIGDTPPPINSHHAGAWGSSHPNDWAGWSAAQILTRQARSKLVNAHRDLALFSRSQKK